MNGRCKICGQRLTDASGSWNLICHGIGVLCRYSGRDWKIKTCSSCQDIINDYIADLRVKRSNQRKKEGWGE